MLSRYRVIHFLLPLLLIWGVTQLVANPPTQVQGANFTCANVTQIPQIECEALVTLYNVTNGANWSNNSGWLISNTPCSWHGVSCLGGRVQELSLPGNNLIGEIPPQLANLADLRKIELHWNGLIGEIPSQLGNLANLETLILFETSMTGEIPPQLGNLNNLRTLALGSYQLHGEIPPQLGNLTNLETLNIHDTQLSGTIPLELTNLSNLRELGLTGNQLQGEIPHQLGTLTNLRGLWLSSNQLSGEIPSELGNLHNLERLGLSNNNLTGQIPIWLSNLSHLEQLHLGRNYLTGQIPPELGNLTQLTRLNLPFNALTGEIPPQLGNLTNLVALSLNGNQLNGYIPPELGNLSNLYTIYLSSNQLTGAIPLSFTNMSNLVAFYFHGTQLCEPPEDAFQDWLSNVYDVSSTGIICVPLADDISSFADNSRHQLLQTGVYAGSVSLVGDYFVDKLQADAIKLAVDTTLNLSGLFSSLNSVDWNLVGSGSGHIATPGFQATSHSWSGWVTDKAALHWHKPLYHAIRDNPELLTREWAQAGINYYARDAGIAVFEGPIKDWLIDELVPGPGTPVRDLFGTPAIELSADYQHALTHQEVELLAILHHLDLSPQQQDIYREDMLARQEANAQMVSRVEQQHDLLWNSYQDALVDEFSWWNLWGKLLLKHAVIGAATLTWDGPGYYAATAGTAAFFTIYDGVQGVRALAHDQKMIDQSIRFLTNRTPQTYSQISLNTVNGLILIRTGVTPQIADGEINNIELHSIGHYRQWPYYLWVEEDSQIALTLGNNAIFPTTFVTSASYTNTGFWVGAQQLTVEGEVKQLGGFSNSPAIIPLKLSDDGLSPDDNSLVNLLVLGATSTGIYPVDNLQLYWNPTRIDAVSEVAASIPAGYTAAEANSIPSVPYPVSSATVNLPESTDYQIVIGVINPFTLTLSTTITQTIPSSFTIIDDDNATAVGDSLVWTTVLSPGGSIELRPLVQWEVATGSTAILPSTEIAFQDPDTALGDNYTTPEKTVFAPWPLKTEPSFPLIWQSNVTETVNITFTNITSNIVAAGVFTTTIETIDGLTLWTITTPINVAPGQSKILSIPVNIPQAGYYVLKGDLLLDTTQKREFLQVVLNKGDIYLPLIFRQ